MHDVRAVELCRWLLIASALLGLLHAAAHSASYQLASRYAGKNTIATGLGACSSGLVILVVQIALQMKTRLSRFQEIAFYELTAGVFTSLVRS